MKSSVKTIVFYVALTYQVNEKKLGLAYILNIEDGFAANSRMHIPSYGVQKISLNLIEIYTKIIYRHT